MTNVESNFKVAALALKEGKLAGAAKSFMEDIKDFDKKQLKNLTSKQYLFLRSISNNINS